MHVKYSAMNLPKVLSFYAQCKQTAHISVCHALFLSKADRQVTKLGTFDTE